MTLTSSHQQAHHPWMVMAWLSTTAAQQPLRFNGEWPVGFRRQQPAPHLVADSPSVVRGEREVGCPGQPTSRLHGRPIIFKGVERNLAQLPSHADIPEGRVTQQSFEPVRITERKVP